MEVALLIRVPFPFKFHGDVRITEEWFTSNVASVNDNRKATIANHPQRLGPGPYPGRPSSRYWELLSEQVRCILFGNYEDKDAVTSAFGLKSTGRAGDCLTICSCLKSATLE